MDYSSGEDQVEVVQLSDDEIKADLQNRRTFIGGSDSPVIMGVSPWKSPYELWLEKTGQTAEPDLSDVERVKFGILLEDVVAREAAERLGVKIRRVNQRQVHPEIPYLVAQIDRRIVGGGILEIKTADASQKAKWKEGIPAHYQFQVQHQFLVTGETSGYVAVLFGGNELQIIKIDRDEEAIGFMLQAYAAFWNLVQTNTPPDPISYDEACLAYRDPAAKNVIGTSDAAHLVGYIETTTKAIKNLEETIDIAKMLLARQMENLGDTLVVDGKPVCTWKMQDRTSFDQDALLFAHPEYKDYYSKTSSSRVLRTAKYGKEYPYDPELCWRLISPHIAIAEAKV